MTKITTDLYFEAHITIDPVTIEFMVEDLRQLTRGYGFRVAEFLYKKNGSVAKPDDFLTTRSVDYGDIVDRTSLMIYALQKNGYRVQRYKIENTLIDCRL